MGALSDVIGYEKGLIDRRIFADQDIYQQELEQIFGRCWLFIGHESQIPNPNDFVANYMGEDPVLLTRNAKGRLHAFLNMCRHRGNRVCRSDRGNSPSFMCTYHGWTFAADGKLVGVPGYKEAYFEELDRSQWGLVETGRIESYKGLVFATWDKQAPSLNEYLGNMTWYLDFIFEGRQNGTELVAGIQKWIMNANWKIACDNFAGDGYHFSVTHGAYLAVRQNPKFNSYNRPTSGNQFLPPNRYLPRGWSVDTGNGHTIGIQPVDYVTQDPTDALPKDSMSRYNFDRRNELRERFGQFRSSLTVGSFNIFPNFSFSSGMRVWHPRGPLKMESWAYVPVDKDAPQEVKNATRIFETQSRGPNGGIEIDDIGNYIDCSTSGRFQMGRRVAMNLQLKSGHEKAYEEFPGIATSAVSENNQRAFYAWWTHMMNSSSWSEVKLNQETQKHP